MSGVPERNTPEYGWWRRGAEAEVAERTKAMTKGVREVWDCVQVLADTGTTEGTDVVEWLARVYGPALPRRRRWRLALELVKGYPR